MGSLSLHSSVSQPWKRRAVAEIIPTHPDITSVFSSPPEGMVEPEMLGTAGFSAE